MTAAPTTELQDRLDRAYQRERDERDERRGLESRGTTLLASSVVAIGLVAAAARGAPIESWFLKGLLVTVGFAFALVTGVLATALAGIVYEEIGDDDEVSLRRFLRRLYTDRPSKKHERPEPAALTERLATQEERVAKIRSANASLVVILGRSTVVFGAAVAGFANFVTLVAVLE